MSPTMQDKTARGLNPPMISQFSIFLDNRVGKLLKLLEIFELENLCVGSVTVLDSTTHGVVRLICTRPDAARKLLDANGFPYSVNDVLIVELEGRHSISAMCQELLTLELNINYLYPLMVRPHGRATIALHADHQMLAGQILLRKGYVLLGESDLRGELEAA